MLRLLLACAIILLPNAMYVAIGAGIPGLNFSNLLFLVLLGALAVSPKDSMPAVRGTGYLTPPLLLLFSALSFAFLITQIEGSTDPLADATRLKNAIFYPLFYFVYRRSRMNLRGTRQLILLVLIVAVGAGLQAIAQGMQYGFGHFVETQRAAGPFGDITMANRAGAFYAMFLPMLAAIAVVFQRKAIRVTALVGCVLLATAILFTYSRQAYLIALVGMLVLLMHRSVLAAILAGALLLGSVTLFPQSVVERVQSTQQVTAAGTTAVDPSTERRMEIWDGALAMWSDHPAGVGLGRFSSTIGEYSRHSGRDAHNTFILVLAEAGPLALAAMLWLLWRLWRLALRIGRAAPINDVETRALALGFKVAVLSMALSNVFGSAFFHGLIMANFWVLCGLLERYAALKTQAAESELVQEYPTPQLLIADRFPLAARAMPGAVPRAPR